MASGAFDTPCTISHMKALCPKRKNGYSAKSHLPVQRRARLWSCWKLGSGCQNCRRSMGGRNDGCCGWCATRAMGACGTREWVWTLGSQTGKLTFTLSPAALISAFINELRVISGGPCRHRPVSLNPANEAAPGGGTAGAAGTTRTSLGSQK